MSPAYFAEFTAYLFFMSVTPGPNTLLSFANASEKGVVKGLPMNLGMVSGITVINTLSYLFLSFFSQLVASFDTAFQVFGLAYLLFLSASMLGKSISGDMKIGGFKFGFLLQVVNVKLIMLCVTGLSLYVIPAKLGMVPGFLLSLMIPAMCFVCQMVWAVLGNFLTDVYKRHTKGFNVIFSLALLLMFFMNLWKFLKSFGVF